MDPPKPPQDIVLKNIIDKLAQFVARNGPDFEQMTKNKQKGNSKFAFLFGEDYHDYYQYKVQSERTRLHTPTTSPQNSSMNPSNPGGLAVWNMLQQQQNNLNQQQNAGSLQHPTTQSSLLPPNVSALQQATAAVIQQQVAAAALAQQVAAVALSQQVTPFSQGLTIEAIKQQQASLQEQTSQSEQNLNAQHVVLLQQQQVAVEEAIKKADIERLQKEADSVNINFNEFNVILQPIIDTCTKDSISNGKAWILQRATSKQATSTLVQYLLQKVLEPDKKFHQRLHIIYLVNDILHHCSRKHITEFMQALESVVVPMFCLTSIGVTEEQQSKLTKLLNIWESKNNYFSSGIVSKLKDPVKSWQEYKDSLQTKYPEIIANLSSQTKTTFQGFQAQHVAFVHHTLQQIQTLEQQKQQLEEVQKQQAAAAVAITIPPPPPIITAEDSLPRDEDSLDEDGPPGVDRSELEGRFTPGYKDHDKFSRDRDLDDFRRDMNRSRDEFSRRDSKEDYDKEKDSSRDRDYSRERDFLRNRDRDQRDQFSRDRERDFSRDRDSFSRNRDDRDDRDRDDYPRDNFNSRDSFTNRDTYNDSRDYDSMNRGDYNQSFNDFNSRDNFNSFREFNNSRDFNDSRDNFPRDFPANREPPFSNNREFSSNNREWVPERIDGPPPGPPPPSNNGLFPDLGINLNQPPPGFLYTPPLVNTVANIELPDVTRPPPGFPPVLPPQPDFQPEDLLPSLPYYDLPAGLMVPLVKLEETSYKSLNPEDIRLPPPAPPSERLLAAVKSFYSPPDHDHPRDSEGWEKLGLYEYFKAKSTAKKNKDTDIMNGLRDLSRSPTPVRSFFAGDKTPPPKRRYSSRSRSKSRERSSSSRRRGRRDRERSPRSSQEKPTPPSLLNMPLLAPPPGHPDYRRTPSPPLFGGAGLGSGSKVEQVDDKLGETNKGHQLLKKMGWGGAGLGANEQGIEAPISSGEVREKADQYKGVGININDPYENFRKSKGQAFITRMKARAEERAERTST